jgi:hypothetical protein
VTKKILFAKIYVNDWVVEARTLTQIQRGFLISVVMAMYERGGSISIADDKWASMALGMDVRSYRHMRQQLVELGILKVENGYLVPPRHKGPDLVPETGASRGCP